MMSNTETAQALIDAGKKFAGCKACNSEQHELLQRLATEHAVYMATRNRLGHDGFNKRYQQIQNELGLSASEIAAESWPIEGTESLADIANQMFKAWKYSSGHWKIASKQHKYFGAEMLRGKTKRKRTIWYAVILVADQSRLIGNQIATLEHESDRSTSIIGYPHA
ncbi:hypothetical protein M0R72_09365 [Candidatus Pacearchaeota archaeon]|jgi:hypothetical protein|nr:hypothetical protein [Candidatus Pacearchaeota archaeon]